MSVRLGMCVDVRNVSMRHKGVRGFRSALLRHKLAWDGARGFGIGKGYSGMVQTGQDRVNRGRYGHSRDSMSGLSHER